MISSRKLICAILLVSCCTLCVEGYWNLNPITWIKKKLRKRREKKVGKTLSELLNDTDLQKYESKGELDERLKQLVRETTAEEKRFQIFLGEFREEKRKEEEEKERLRQEQERLRKEQERKDLTSKRQKNKTALMAIWTKNMEDSVTAECCNKNDIFGQIEIIHSDDDEVDEDQRKTATKYLQDKEKKITLTRNRRKNKKIERDLETCKETLEEYAKVLFGDVKEDNRIFDTLEHLIRRTRQFDEKHIFRTTLSRLVKEFKILWNENKQMSNRQFQDRSLQQQIKTGDKLPFQRWEHYKNWCRRRDLRA